MQGEPDRDYYRARAEREIALAKATGAKAHASADYRTVFIERADGSKEKVRVPPPGKKPN
jgi:hypothetical protein